MSEEKNWTKCQNWNSPKCPNVEDPAMVMTYNVHPEKSDLAHIWKKVDRLCEKCPEFDPEPEYA